MLDHPGKRYNAFDMKITEQIIDFCYSLLIPVAINTSQWNCCFGNMADILHFMCDTESEDFFSMNTLED